MNEIVPQEPSSELADQINAAHDRAEAALRAGLEHARAAGDLLIRAKDQCSHGGWLPWLTANVRFSTRTAQAYMRIAHEWGRLTAKCATVAHLGYREALQVLADSDRPAEVTSLTPEASDAAWREKMEQGLAALQQVFDDPDAPVEVLVEVRDLAEQAYLHAAERKLRAERALGLLLRANEQHAEPLAGLMGTPPLTAGRWYQGVATDAGGAEVLVEIAPHPDHAGHWVWSFTRQGSGDDAYCDYQARGCRLSPSLLADILKMHKLAPQLWSEHKVRAGFEPFAVVMDRQDKAEGRGRWSWMKDRGPIEDRPDAP